MTILAIALADPAETPSVFNLSLGTSFWTVVIFLVLLFVLAKFAFPPILGYAAARERRIQEILDSAAREREEAERLLEEQRRQIAEARQEAQQLLAEGRQAGERMREEILAGARAQQEEMLERAKQEIARERERAVEALRAEAVELSLAAASKLLGQRMDAETDRRLVQDYLGRVAAGDGQGAA